MQNFNSPEPFGGAVQMQTKHTSTDDKYDHPQVHRHLTTHTHPSPYCLPEEIVLTYGYIHAFRTPWPSYW